MRSPGSSPACRCSASSTASSGSRSSRPGAGSPGSLPGLSIGRKLAITGATIVTIAVALAVAVAFNPYLTAQPAGALSKQARPLLSKNVWQRFHHQVELRLDDLELPEDELSQRRSGRSSREGPGDPGAGLRPVRAVRTARVRLDECAMNFRQDWGMFLWLPLVLLRAVRVGPAGSRRSFAPASRPLRWRSSSGPSAPGWS